MKNSLLRLFLVLSIVLFSSCDNEPLEGFDLTQLNTPVIPDITIDPSTISVEGIWKLTAWNATNAVDINNDGTASINLLEELNCYNNETIIFNADNTAVSMSRSYAEIELILIIGTTNDYEYTVNCIPEIENGNATWTQVGNIVAITDAVSGTNNFTKNNNELSFLVPAGFNTTSNNGSVTVTEDLVFVYTKQ